MEFSIYAVDGEFGKVRHVRRPLGVTDTEVPFHFLNAGWHCCNEKYCYRRDGRQKDHLLLFSVSAGGVIQLGDREAVRLPASSVAWLPPGCRHVYNTAPGEIWEFYWMHLDAEDYLKFEKVFDEQSILKITNMDRICKEFERLLRNRRMDADEFQIESSCVVGNIYHILLQESRLQKRENVRNDELVQDIVRDMESDCGRDWKLPEIAGQHFISVPQLIRRFKGETGMTPYAYLTTIRLQTAELQLRYTSLSVEEISRKVGFPSTSNFIVQFRKYRGMTPQRYRQSGR